MPTRVWRLFALAGALFALCFAIADLASPATFVDGHVATDSVDGRTFDRLRVTNVDGTPTENGGLQPGDIVIPIGGFTLRMRQNAEPPGTTHAWRVFRGTQPSFIAHTQVTRESSRDILLDTIIHIVRFAMLFVGLLVAVRRPDVRAARALVTFLIIMALTMYPGGTWLSDRLFAVWRTIHGPLQIYSLSQGLLFACVFPFVSTSGLRLWLARFNPWYTLVAAGCAFAQAVIVELTGSFPPWGGANEALSWLPIGYFPLIFAAFTVAIRQATGSDRVRVYWAAGSICVGFSGPVVQTLAVFLFHWYNDVGGFFALTLIALPLGLAYTILRHRTVDIGFVISRALVLTILSFAIVAVFGLLERALGKLFIDASHVASRSVEIALALGLGFSMRSLHARIETFVDRFFFRTRRRALAALKTFAGDVYFITDADVAIERTVAVVGQCSEAENAALYLIADGVFRCAASVNDGGLPVEVDENDPLFVRMRASRHMELLRGIDSALDTEIAFPMFVRGTLVGALTLAAKRSGEAYDPEETALIADLAQRVGLALDALQTLAMRKELDALILTR